MDQPMLHDAPSKSGGLGRLLRGCLVGLWGISAVAAMAAMNASIVMMALR